MRKSNVQETSKEAYNSLDQSDIRDIYQRIIWALSQIGEGTYEDIAKCIKEKDQRVWKRLSEMANQNLIYRTENKRELSSGRKGFTWKLTMEQMPTIQDHSRNIQTISKQAQQYKTQTLF